MGLRGRQIRLSEYRQRVWRTIVYIGALGVNRWWSRGSRTETMPLFCSSNTRDSYWRCLGSKREMAEFEHEI